MEVLAPPGGWDTAVTSKNSCLVAAVWAVAFLLLSARPLLVSLALCVPIAFLCFAAVRIRMGTSTNMAKITSCATHGPWILRYLLAPQAFTREKPRFLFVTHPIGHYAEGLRWCMDLAKVPYEEKNLAALLSALLRGRSIPFLMDRATDSLISNSEEARMYVSAVHVPTLTGELKSFAKALLERTPEALEWESRLAHLGHDVQGFAYYYLLGGGSNHDPEYPLRYWGAHEPHVPWLDRKLLIHCYPLIQYLMRKTTLALDDHNLAKSRRENILTALDAADSALKKTGAYLLGSHLSYVDIIFSSLMAPLLPSAHLPRSDGPPAMHANGRFSSYNRGDDHSLSRFPKALLDFEKSLKDRPAGKHVLQTYKSFRKAA